MMWSLLLVLAGPAWSQPGSPNPPAPVDVAPKQVAKAADLEGLAGQRATLTGTLQRATPPGSTSPGTAVVLDDGTAVFVSWGEPPAGWAWMLSTRVRVLGRLFASGAPNGPALPTLSEPETPMPADAGVPSF
jgi:hypothetical protein